MTSIPILNLEFGQVKDAVWSKLQEPKSQRKLILVIVSIALLLDNMLYMVIVPIIPDYLRYVGAWGNQPEVEVVVSDNETSTTQPGTPVHRDHHGQDSATGILFASKAIVQLMVNPFSGALIDRIGYDMPMMVGLTIMFLSTAVFACGRSYGVLFFARSLQGVGSAFADTSGLAMIADRFTEENERSKALGIALAFISFGCLVAPPFGGALYQFAGKEVPFLILAFVSLADGFMLLLVMKPIKQQIKDSRMERPKGTPIWRLFIDPYIAVCSGALMMSNVALAFLEPTISLWMEDNLTTDNWKIGMIWLPAFFPHVFGVILTVKIAKRYPQYQWLMAAGGLALEGLCCFIIPFSSSYKVLMIPICGICFGIALIDTALLPTLGYLVDVRYVSVYGSIYAIADISYSLAYAVGPIIAGGVVEAIGFTALNIGIAFSNLLYAPVLVYLRHIYDFKPLENEANILMSDPPDKEYQTYTMHDQKPVVGEFKNHLEYARFPDENNTVDAYYPDGHPTKIQETNIDRQDGANGYAAGSGTYFAQQAGYQQQDYQPQQQAYSTQQQGYQPQNQTYQPQQHTYQYQPTNQRAPSVQQPSQSVGRTAQASADTNPFRASSAGGGESEVDKNPFRQGLG
ncbi:hypothetical protein PR048_029286 [Dryococelus australis]|uniref:Major facilitator superfamily (MFS) profile domain-containing protein n=1 Tax=Dryococelus australis TaxID=614101 RepID=A0ABQ9GCY1_9NEOP|nr:hypothetical protein PR048_029286 [Dryococelus australis]